MGCCVPVVKEENSGVDSRMGHGLGPDPWSIIVLCRRDVGTIHPFKISTPLVSSLFSRTGSSVSLRSVARSLVGVWETEVSVSRIDVNYDKGKIFPISFPSL